MPDVNSVKLGGSVLCMRKWKTRSEGKPALTLTLSYGEEGEVDVLVFGESAKKIFAQVGRKKARVVVHGRLTDNGEILANNVVPIG